MNLRKLIVTAMIGCGMASGGATVAAAGDYSGDFMVRLQGTYLVTDDDTSSARLGAAALPGTEASTSNSVLPTATLTYFFTKNLAAELLCCFAHSSVNIKSLAGGAGVGEVGGAWMFPPAVTLQYHFDGLGKFKPYLGAGVQWIHFFKEDTGTNALGATKIDIDDAFGFVLQAGLDVELGGGWYANADFKKSFLDTTVTLHDVGGPGVHAVAKHDLDPMVFSVGIGLRFNLFGPRYTEPLK